jgi:hypothetical protein
LVDLFFAAFQPVPQLDELCFQLFFFDLHLPLCADDFGLLAIELLLK